MYIDIERERDALSGPLRQLAQQDVESLWAQFEQIEPTHAANARRLVEYVYV